MCFCGKLGLIKFCTITYLFPKLYKILVYLEDSRNRKIWETGLDQVGGAPLLHFQVWVCGQRPASEEGVCPHVSPANAFLLQHVRTSWVIWGTHRTQFEKCCLFR